MVAADSPEEPRLFWRGGMRCFDAKIPITTFGQRSFVGSSWWLMYIYIYMYENIYTHRFAYACIWVHRYMCACI